MIATRTEWPVGPCATDCYVVWPASGDHEIKAIDFVCKAIDAEDCVFNWVGHQDAITSQEEFGGK